MKCMIGVLAVFFFVVLPFAAPAQEEPVFPDEEIVDVEFLPPEEGEGAPPPPPAPRFHPGQRKKRGFAPFPFKQFRNQIRNLGRDIRENQRLIESLREELEAMPPGVDRAEVRRKLAEAERRQAELELILARRRVEIAKRGRDISQERYDNARLELENVKQRVKLNYPELVPE